VCATASPSKFFASLPKNTDKKRPQISRTQPYKAPYFVAPPVPPIPADELRREKLAKRSATLPAGETETSVSIGTHTANIAVQDGDVNVI
jgi:hypothetical protein